MKNLKVSEAVKTKLPEKHQVTLREVEHCFENIEGRLLYDDRVWTKTHPPHLGSLRQPTQTVCSKSCIQIGNQVVLKTADEPNAQELAIYERFGKVA